MNNTTKSISLAFTMFAIVGMFSFAPVAASDDDEGCTPGFWKANAKKGANAWPGPPDEINPDTLLTDLGVVNAVGYDITDLTFLEALSLKGGNSLAEKEEILLRAGAAALLNAAQLESDLDYVASVETTTALLNAALASDDKSVVTSVASLLDAANNLGCPFNNSGKPIRD